MRIVTARVVSLGLGSALACAVAWAGAQARLVGSVKDSAGKPIAGVTITITSDEVTGFEKQVELKEDGTFSTLLLDATRHYTFRVAAPGYQTQQRPFKVPAGTTDNVFDFILKSDEELREEDRQQVLERPGFKEMAEANALLQEGKTAEAEAKLEEAVKALPELSQGWMLLAQLAVDRGESVKGLERARRCLEVDDEAATCLAVAANAAKALGDTAASEQYMARYQQLNPEDPAVLFNQAAGFINQNDDAQARPLLEKCIQIDPVLPKCLFEYGMLLLRSGDMAGAKAQLQRYLELAPEGDDSAAVQETLKYL